ncbi:UDP-N-acetylmuramate dehydrogenase [Orrella daihaiensis]|uniref:UDP-N-acetylenolpyruvoylglucosamine reductase n=1 Tax=Orrella daihaiensis TaxID=2782176 RepID=A0ABY4AQM6_9BURK|nr:UDP-N-acetylmuramate dehydrogenase [Orrella daihaiensis]UOD51355.1 UDP-N-acetylmuramate dehydrogenase [Orrella daihaiensis]
MTVPNTMALPCVAKQAIVYEDASQLDSLQALFDQCGSLSILGGASNVILPATLDRPVVLMRSRGIEQVGATDAHWLIDVAAGENWHEWVKTSLSKDWPGLENLAMIPGTVGAAPIQNIGAYGVELAHRVQGVQVWDFEGRCRRWLSVEQCQFGYRDSVFKTDAGKHWMVLTVRFALPKIWQPVLDYPDLWELTQRELGTVSAQEVFDRVVAVRQAKLPDPAVKPNVGSFFKNPVISQAQAKALVQRYPTLVSYPQPNASVKLAAGWLIDQCGFKGKRVGPMAVHDRQALVLVNEGGATADDVMQLASEVKAAVMQKFGVALEMEPSLW